MELAAEYNEYAPLTILSSETLSRSAH